MKKKKHAIWLSDKINILLKGNQQPVFSLQKKSNNDKKIWPYYIYADPKRIIIQLWQLNDNSMVIILRGKLASKLLRKEGIQKE